MDSKKRPKIFNDIVAGSMSGIVLIIIITAFTTIIFTGSLAHYFYIGFSFVFLGAVIVNLYTTSFGSIPFSIARPEPAIGAILSIMFIKISEQTLHEASLLPTLLTVTALVSLLAGISMFFLGYFKLGQTAWFIPFPVTGGVVLGSAWIIGRTSFQLVCHNDLSLQNLLQWNTLQQLSIGLGITLFLLYNKRYWVLPVCIIVASVLINFYLFIAHVSYEEAVKSGWLFSLITPSLFLKTLNFAMVKQIDWSVIISQAGYIASVIGLIIIIILFNVTALEAQEPLNIDIEKELKVSGMANIMSGLLLAFPANLSLSGTILNKNFGGVSRLSGITASCVCIFIVFVCPSIITYLPIPVIAALLFYIASRLMLEKLYQGWYQLPLSDYFITVVIWLIIAAWSFLPGALIGILITCMFFVFHYAKINAIKFVTSGKYYHSNVIRPPFARRWLTENGSKIRIIELQGYLFFGSTKALFDDISHLIERKAHRVQFIIFDFQLVNGSDSSAGFSWVRLQQLVKNTQLQLIFTHCSPSLIEKIEQQTKVTGSTILFFPALDKGLEWCEEKLLEQIPKGRILAEEPIVNILSQLIPNRTQQDLFKQYLEKFEIKASQYLIKQGEKDSDTLCFIESGEVSISLESFKGTIRLLKAGSGVIIGEIGFYLRMARSASVYAETDCVGYRLSINTMDKIEELHPEIAMVFHKNMSVILANRLVQTNYLLQVME